MSPNIQQNMEYTPFPLINNEYNNEDVIDQAKGHFKIRKEYSTPAGKQQQQQQLLQQQQEEEEGGSVCGTCRKTG